MDSQQLKEIREKIIKIADGNPASITVLSQLYFLGLKDSFNYVNELVKLNIIGVDIWLMYKNECQENIENMKILIREKNK
tara:strand:- start:244 stop:483 length:240 start_codon:yes stop_codon:yes gene_type:complete